ncbi:MAG: hypothetical protein WHX52_22375 [Anaerolineae bacterium]
MKATHRPHVWLNALLLASLLLTLMPIEALRASAPEAQLTPLRLPQVMKMWATPQTLTQDPPRLVGQDYQGRGACRVRDDLARHDPAR